MKRKAEDVVTMARKNAKRFTDLKLLCTRMTEPMIPGEYTIKFRIGDDILQETLAIYPGDTFESFVDFCEGFCIGAGDDRGMPVSVVYNAPKSSSPLGKEVRDVFQNGMVLKSNDAMYQGNIYLTPELVREVVQMAGAYPYGKRVAI